MAFSICRQVPDTRLSTRPGASAARSGSPPTPCPAARPWAGTSPRRSPTGFDCVVLENHGVVTAGAEPAGGVRAVRDAGVHRQDGHQGGPARRRSATSTTSRPARPRPPAVEPRRFAPGPVTSHEKELRRQLCEFVRRGYRQRLMISTQGAFSARLDADVVPDHAPRGRPAARSTSHDLVLVRDGAAEAGKTPSSSARNHRAIYAAHPEIQAIVNAYPVNATAFSVTDAAARHADDPRELPVPPRGPPRPLRRPVRRRPPSWPSWPRSRDPILILENDGVQVCGTSVLDAFDRLEVLESTAEAMINAVRWADGADVGRGHRRAEASVRHGCVRRHGTTWQLHRERPLAEVNSR